MAVAKRVPADSAYPLPFLRQEQASSPEFGPANTVFPSLGLRTPNHPISPGGLASSCVDVVSPQANGQEASSDEKPAFLRRPAYLRRKLAALPSAVHPSQTEDFTHPQSQTHRHNAHCSERFGNALKHFPELVY